MFNMSAIKYYCRTIKYQSCKKLCNSLITSDNLEKNFFTGSHFPNLGRWTWWRGPGHRGRGQRRNRGGRGTFSDGRMWPTRRLAHHNYRGGARGHARGHQSSQRPPVIVSNNTINRVTSTGTLLHVTTGEYTSLQCGSWQARIPH